MADVDSRQIIAFLQALGKRYTRPTKLILLGGGALCLLGSPRPTLDIDYLGDDLIKDEFQKAMDEIAGEMGFEADAVPIHEFTPLSYGREERAIDIGTFGNVQVSIIDPYVIALSKLDRGFDTDIDDIVFLIRKGLVALPQLEMIVQDVLPGTGKFDINPSDMLDHLQAVSDSLK